MAKKLPPVPLVPGRPGVSKKYSNLTLADRWIDSDKVRMVDGLPEKIGGWSRKTGSSVTDAIRGLLFWNTMTELPFIGFGTYRKLYVADQALDPVDITPVGSTGTLTDPFTVVLGSSTVTVAHTAHNRAAGDQVTFSGASLITGTGMTIDGTYSVTSVPNPDSYTIEHGSAATDNGSGGGMVSYSYELSIGVDNPTEGDGYGAGPYGLYDYGAPTEATTGGVVFEPRVWNLDQYGDWMLANPVGGGIYKFDPTATPAYVKPSLLANAPTVCRFMFVTRERFIFALGVGNDPMNIKWSDQDDPTNWTPGAASTAGARRLTLGTKLVGGVSIGNLLTGVWSDTSLYRFQYTGSSFIYDSRAVGSNCGLVSPLAMVVNLSTVFWASQNGRFFMWSGGAPSLIPNVDDVQQYVRGLMRANGYEFKCNGYYNATFNEVWWFFASTTQTDPGIYVAVSLNDYSWVVGTMERTSGGFFNSSDQRPILAGADGYLYQHEDGLDGDGAIIKAYIRRGPLRIASGERLGEVNGVVNDMQRQVGTMSYDVKTYERFNDGVLDTDRVAFEPGEDLIDLRIGGRIADITIRSEALGGDFRLGTPMLEVIATGRRR